MEPSGRRTSTKLCLRCVLLVTALTVAGASPARDSRQEASVPEEPESLRVRETSYQQPDRYQAGVSQSDKEIADDFLKHYGYFRKGNPLPMLEEPVDETGDRQERDVNSDAIRMFQSYYGLPQTGRLDAKTLALMKKDRCGVEDIPEDGGSQKPSAFSVMDNKWEKDRLTWRLSRPTRQIDHGKQRSILTDALDTWARQAPLHFQETTGEADIDILFGARDHGDRYPFDGPSKVLAHAYGPIYSTSIKGDVHFDDDETWTTDNVGHGSDVLIVATHELGHSLGLKHSRDPNALMYPYYGMTNTLGQDDIQAIQYLYGKRIDIAPTTGAPPVTNRPEYTTRRPTHTLQPRPVTSTTTTTTPPPTIGCRVDFDVVIKDVSYDRDVYTGIVGDKMFRFDQDGLEPGYPTSLHLVYPGAPVNADAVFTNPYTHSTYFVSYNKVWRYTDFVLDADYPRTVDPTHFPETVRFVLPFENEYGRIERIFVFGSTWFWEYNFDAEQSFKPTPYLISQYWRQVRNDVRYAVRWTDNNMYFISPNYHVVLTRMRSQTNRGDEEGHPKWLQNICPHVAAYLPQSDSGAMRLQSAPTILLTAILSLLLLLLL